jgi:pyruvate/2-oxoacid:ferredoxin oxidoreductase beta subunit
MAIRLDRHRQSRTSCGVVNMTYIVENNGVYGLTKGQFSDRRPRLRAKRGAINTDEGIDLVLMALRLAPPMSRAASQATSTSSRRSSRARSHTSAAFIDVVSPAWRSTTTRAPPRATTTRRAQRSGGTA